MEHSDYETLITINDADMHEGYFRFYTTRMSDFNRVMKRIGGRTELVKLKTTCVKSGAINSWDCWIPAKYLSRSTFAIRAKTPVSDEKREQQRVRAAAAGFGRKSATGLGAK